MVWPLQQRAPSGTPEPGPCLLWCLIHHTSVSELSMSLVFKRRYFLHKVASKNHQQCHWPSKEPAGLLTAQENLMVEVHRLLT